MSDHAKAAPTVGRCGMHCPGMFATSPTVVCALPAGHAGWHRSDEGTEWGISESGLPMDTTVVAAYERGVAAGRRQAAADALRKIADDVIGVSDPTDVDDAERMNFGEVRRALTEASEVAPAEPVEEATP